MSEALASTPSPKPTSESRRAPGPRSFWRALKTGVIAYVIIAVPIFALVMGLAIIVGVVAKGMVGLHAALAIWPWALSTVCGVALGAAVRRAWRETRRLEVAPSSRAL